MKPTLVLIPGAWHTSSAYDTLIPYLTKEGYEANALTLPSVGPASADDVTSLKPDIEHIRQHIIPLLDSGKDVVLVMHSYGGIPGSSAMHDLSKKERQADGKEGGVVALVFVTAWMIPKGQSAKGMGGGRGGKGGPTTLKIENDLSQHLDPINAMYHDVDPELAQKFASGLRPFSVHTLTATTTYAGHEVIPSTYLLCLNDRMIPHERQVALVQGAGVPITTFTCDASHSPFASQPEFTARVIRHAAGEDIEVEGL